MSEREAPRLEPLARATRLGRRWPGGVGRVELDLERLYPLGTAIGRSGRCSRHHVDEPYAIVGLLAPVTSSLTCMRSTTTVAGLLPIPARVASLVARSSMSLECSAAGVVIDRLWVGITRNRQSQRL